MKATYKLTVLGLTALIALPACQQRPAPNQVRAQAASPASPASTDRPNPKVPETAPAPPSGPVVHSETHINDAGVIPSQGAVKTRTTNEFGGTTYGLGSSVYSLIGSSGLHSDGLSSHLESRLGGAGIAGVRVLAIDDMVVLAAESRQPTAARYDAMQQKVLSNTGGQSTRGPEPGKMLGTTGTGRAGDDNLDMAENQIRQFLGANVKVLKITGQQAVDTINRIRSYRNGSTVSAQALSDDIGTLLRLGTDNKK